MKIFQYPRRNGKSWVMTRVRVLLRAKKLLLDGFIPYGTINGCATDAVGNVVSYMHPKAKRFTLFGAVDRAVFDLTGDDFRKREALKQAAFSPLFYLAGNYQALRDVATGPVEKVISLIDKQLKEWDV